MICNISGQSDESIEQVNVSINSEPKVLVKSELNAENQSIYDAYCALFMVNITVCIENFDDYVDCARFCSDSISDSPLTFDYLTITSEEKGAIDNFISLVNSL